LTDITLQPPDYNVTPPQANNITKLITLILELNENSTEINNFWKKKFHPNENYNDEKVIAKINRDFGYYLNAAKWLRMVPIGTKQTVNTYQRVNFEENGRILIFANVDERFDVIRKIILQDPIFRKIEQFSNVFNEDESAFRRIIIAEIQDERNPWRNFTGKNLTESTANRRLSCAISWSKSLGILI
jgi:hypothetical protein